MSHFALMLTHALLLSVFFSTLWRRQRLAQLKLFAQLFFGLLLGGLAAAWLMYPFPSSPPSPIP